MNHEESLLMHSHKEMFSCDSLLDFPNHNFFYSQIFAFSGAGFLVKPHWRQRISLSPCNSKSFWGQWGTKCESSWQSMRAHQWADAAPHPQLYFHPLFCFAALLLFWSASLFWRKLLHQRDTFSAAHALCIICAAARPYYIFKRELRA
jgi:hypothetical protein